MATGTTRASRFWHCPRLWPGERGVILGGGPSLADEPALALLPKPGVRVIAINRAIEIAPWADVHFAADHNFYQRLGSTLDGFAGLKVTVNPLGEQFGAHRMRWAYIRRGSRPPRKPLPPLALETDALSGACSGGLSINLSAHLGPDDWALVGFDFKRGPGGRSNWHEGYGGPPRPFERLWGKEYAPAIERMAPMLVKLGKRVVNCNPDSALRAFPFASLEAFLR